ncbi:MAG: hypothetical protein AB1656_20350 [Candidatus Omnitrophota bacterium]
MNEITDPDNKPFSESSKMTFLNAVKKELAKKSRTATAEQKEAILKRIPTYIHSRVGGEGTLTTYTMDKGIVKKEIVKGAAFKEKLKNSNVSFSAGNADSPEENMKNNAMDLMYGIDIALSQEHPIPIGEERKAIEMQCNQLIAEATAIVKKKFPDLSDENINEAAQFVLGRITRKIDDPFSKSTKQLLKEEQVAKLMEKWNDPEIFFKWPMPYQRNIMDATRKFQWHKAQAERSMNPLFDEWRKLYKEEEIR